MIILTLKKNLANNVHNVMNINTQVIFLKFINRNVTPKYVFEAYCVTRDLQYLRFC